MERKKITIERIPLAELEDNRLTTEARLKDKKKLPPCIIDINERRLERLDVWISFAKANHKDYIYKCHGRVLNYPYGDIIFNEMKRMEDAE